MGELRNIYVSIIDAQTDFVDPNEGALYVENAWKDMIKLGHFIEKHSHKIDGILSTLDLHHLMDVGHPLYWMDKNGNHPPPFTIISPEDIAEGHWIPVNPDLFGTMLSYARELEMRGRQALCIWPPHCIIGSPGANICPPILTAINGWEQERNRSVEYIFKGMDPETEHYSAVRAEVPNGSTTEINYKLVDYFDPEDLLLIGGEASSHCVANTVRDMVDILEEEEYGSFENIVLLTDTMSPVTGFEDLEQNFFNEMKEKGLRLATTKEISVEI